jgi:3-oxoacyl-[acyl-carrier-protein] synthase-3
VRFERVGLRAVAHVRPPVEVTSEALEDRLAPVYERLGLRAGRLELMTGIRARRFWPAPVRPSAIAAEAGRAALSEADLSPAALGAVVFCGVCRDQLEPASANAAHHGIGAGPRCLVFDLSNACLGMLNGMWLVASLIEQGQIEHGLVVAGEDGRPLVEQTVDRLRTDPSISRRTIKQDIASLTVGSGAAAVLLSRHDRGRRLLGGVYRAATEHHGLCVGGGGEQLSMATDSEALLEAGLGLAATTFEAFRDELGGEWDRVITHQVGRTHERRLLELLGLDPESTHRTFPDWGNVGSVALPMTLSDGLRKGFITGEHSVALLGIGSGLNCMMMGVSP